MKESTARSTPIFYGLEQVGQIKRLRYTFTVLRAQHIGLSPNPEVSTAAHCPLTLSSRVPNP